MEKLSKVKGGTEYYPTKCNCDSLNLWRFLKRQQSAIFISFYGSLGPPIRVVGLYRCAKFGCNQQCSL